MLASMVKYPVEHLNIHACSRNNKQVTFLVELQQFTEIVSYRYSFSDVFFKRRSIAIKDTDGMLISYFFLEFQSNEVSIHHCKPRM